MALDHGYHVRRLSPLYGKLSIYHDLVMFHDHNWLVDRNTLLMYKDVCIARFHSLLAIEHRLYPKYQDDHLKLIQDLYRKGEQVMEHHGVNIYNGAALLEPFATERLGELARSYRPLIPVDPRYKNHVDRILRCASSEISVGTVRRSPPL